ncbi:MAG: VWA domain-containing protein, partial [Pirellulales bacterium]
MDSGFGPFGLCRLTYETGGLYFTVHPNRETGRRIRPWETAAMASHLGSFFYARVMRNYRPQYVPTRQYYDFVKSHLACAALVEAAQLSAITPMEDVRLRFPRIDDAQFARDLSNAQRTAAKLEPKVAALAAILRQGERDRDKVTTPRWQAGFDLAIGRALAVKVHTEGYNAMLAEAKQGLKFKDEQSDTWLLRPADSVTTGSALAKDADDSRKYLERVVAEHKGTPWALDAERELREPFGWEWREEFTDVAGRLARAEAARNRPRPERPEPPRKPRRDPPAL